MDETYMTHAQTRQDILHARSKNNTLYALPCKSTEEICTISLAIFDIYTGINDTQEHGGESGKNLDC